MFSKFFIERPVLTIVISIAIVLAGAIAVRDLPVKQYPTITPPTIMVRAVYPGADPETLSKTVAAPLEEAINGVENMIYMTSTASPNGVLMISVTFAIGTDPNVAKVDVNNRVQLALNKLPEIVRRLGVSVRERTPDILKFYAFVSKNGIHDVKYIANYVSVNVLDSIKRVKGVGDAMIFGQKEYSMRIWLKPDKLKYYGLSVSDVINAIRSQNEQYAAGSIGAEPIKKKGAYTYLVTTRGRFKRPEEFANIIIRSNPDGSSLKLKDVAKVELGQESYSVSSDYNGKRAVWLGVWLSAGANALDVSKRVDEKMKELSANFPKDIKYYDVYDIASFIKASIKEVVYTLLISIALAVVVIYIFLGTVRSTIIPALAIPISIVGTFAGFYVAGFSINLLTLFGLVLAVGLVVDDAIVVIENTDRIIKTEGLTPKEAAIKSMQELTQPLVAIVLVLDSVFVPASFVGGFAGKMYQQFALTIATSVTISGFVALTLTPTLCALILKKGGIRETRFSKAFYKFFNKLTNGFLCTSKQMIKLYGVSLLIFASVVGGTLFMGRMLPTGLVPEEDKGYIMILYYLMPGSSLSRTVHVQKEIEKICKTNPNIVSTSFVSGVDLISFAYKTDSGIGWARLKDWSERNQTAWDIVGELSRKFYLIKDGLAIPANIPPIMGMSMTSGFDMFVQDRTGGDIHLLDMYTKKLVEAANKDKRLMLVRSSLNTNVPQYRLVVDREKAKALNVPIASIFRVLESTFGSYYVNDFNLFGRTYHVNLEAEGNYRSSPKDYRYVFVRSLDGKFVPISSLVHIKRVVGPDVVQRFNMFTAAHVTGRAALGYTTGDAMKAIKEIAKKVLPNGYTIAWSGTSYQEAKVSKSSNMVFIYTIVFVFLILAALYESFIIPFPIVLVVPFAVFGAVLGLFLGRYEKDIYFNIGVLVLMGLSAKNAILLVKFALDRLKGGSPLLDATIEGARIRFRPIIMTSIVFIAGSLPLIIWGGAGAVSRHIIGTTVVFGMTMQTVVGTLFIPLFFYLIMKIRGLFRR